MRSGRPSWLLPTVCVLLSSVARAAPLPGPADVGRIVPVYRLTAGLTATTLRRAVRDALDRAGAAYPEYLPERLRSLIAGRVGVRDEQVVIGVGATGVILQVLHAVTSPGE